MRENTPASDNAAVNAANAANAALPQGARDREDWWGQFHLRAFLSVTWVDKEVERRELVWIRRFFEHHGRPDCYDGLCEAIRLRQHTDEALDRLLPVAHDRMSSAAKRRFVYNLAQLCKSKGGMATIEYEKILDISLRLGMPETQADSIINSVFNINDTFTAIVGLTALGAILYFMRVVFVPLVIAIFLTMIVNRIDAAIAKPLRLGRWRPLSKLAAMLLVVTTLCGLVVIVVQSGSDIAGRLPFYRERLGEVLTGAQQAAARLGWPPVSDAAQIGARLRELPIGSTLGGLLGSVVTIVGNFVLVVIFTGFLAFSGGASDGILQEMNEKITAYISVKTLSSLLTGVAVFVLCWWFGIDFAMFWASIVVLLNFIPTVGSIVASVPPILLAAIQLPGWSAVAAFALALTAVHVLIGQVLEPKLMGDKLAVKPAAILLGLIFWGFLWGIPGMFLAAPLMALLRILASYFNFSRNLERLLAAD